MKYPLLLCLVTSITWQISAQFEYVPLKHAVCLHQAEWSSGPKINKDAPRPVYNVKQRAVTFNFNYLPAGAIDPISDSTRTCATFPADARTALEHAAAIWGNILTSPRPITIDACWTSMGDSAIASAQPTGYGVAGTPMGPAQYPVALANALSNMDINGALSEIEASFNLDESWYFATDSMTPINQLDFVTTCLHELAHGLGFAGSAMPDTSNPTSATLWSPPTLADYKYEDGGGNAVTTAIPSTLLNTILGQNGGLFVNGANSVACFGAPVPMYAPDPWQPGRSFSHFDESPTGSTSGELMSAITANGERIHDPGLAVKFLQDLGWEIQSLPVDLISFSGRKEAGTVTLQWTTANEIDLESYLVQRSNDLVNWEEITRLTASTGSQQVNEYRARDLRPAEGSNHYRLKILHLDEAYEFSNVIEVRFDEKVKSMSLHPNPVSDLLYIDYRSSANPIEVSVFGMNGNPVLKTTIESGENSLEVGRLLPGKYIIEIQVGSHLERSSFIKQ